MKKSKQEKKGSTNQIRFELEVFVDKTNPLKEREYAASKIEEHLQALEEE